MERDTNTAVYRACIYLHVHPSVKGYEHNNGDTEAHAFNTWPLNGLYT